MSKRQAKTISIIEVLAMFSTEHKAVKWLENRRWQGKPRCPHCGGTDNIYRYKSKKHTYHHKDCRKQFTVKTKTVMHGSNLDVKKWAIAIYYLLTARQGISSLQLSKELGITQKSAWFMLQRIREACKQGDFKLSGSIEIDETYLGGKEGNKHKNKQLKAGRGGVGKTAVIGMRERGGHTRAMPTAEVTKTRLHRIVRKNVRPGSTIYTDDNPSYTGALRRHKTVNHSAKEYVNGMAHTNGIESVQAVLKRGYTGTFHHISAKHLSRYVNEFAFRLNEGNAEIDTMDRMTALVQGMSGKRLAYKDLIK